MSVRPDNYPKPLTGPIMIYRWVAAQDIPELGLLRGDLVTYEPQSKPPYTVTRALVVDPGAVLNQSNAGALVELVPFDFPRLPLARPVPPLQLVKDAPA